MASGEVERNLSAEIVTMIADIEAMKRETESGSKKRLLSIAATHLETAYLFLKESKKV